MGRRGKRKLNKKTRNKPEKTKRRARRSPEPVMEPTEETIVYFWSSRNQGKGHVSMKLPNGVYISFRSLSQEYKVKVEQPSFPRHLNDDIEIEGSEPETTLNIPSFRLQEEPILSWWQDFTEQKAIFLLNNQSCQVIYKALSSGGSDISEPLYWTLTGLERYVRKLCRQRDKKIFGDILSIDWFCEMDYTSKLLFLLMTILVAAVVVMAVVRISPQGSEDGHTCYNDYGPCKEYVSRFLEKPSPLDLSVLKKYSNIMQLGGGLLVILLCSRFSMDDLIRFMRMKLHPTDDEIEAEGEVGTKEQVEEDDYGDDDDDEGDDDDSDGVDDDWGDKQLAFMGIDEQCN